MQRITNSSDSFRAPALLLSPVPGGWPPLARVVEEDLEARPGPML